MNIPRTLAGSVVLGSKKAFCFAGLDSKKIQESVEFFQTDSKGKWKIVYIENVIGNTVNFASVYSQNKVLLFGGGGF